MGELTIEEKASRYDEAIEIARKINSGEGVAAPPDWTTCEVIFPELKETEDERIRKALIKYFRNCVSIEGIDGEDISNWLEKQGEKTVDKLQVSGELYEHIRNTCACIDDALSSETLADINDYLSMAERSAQSAFDMIEKQDPQILANSAKTCKDEQNPVDKVEPKFKDGDWVVYGDEDVDLITGLCDKGYEVNHCAYIPFGCEDDMRYWNIQDAKDGDVLYATGLHNECIFIFDGIGNWRFDEPNGDRAVATGYCYLSVSENKTKFGMQGPYCIEVCTVKPATKEQRDLLFTKMEEEGYEWDAEKKELKKIERKPVNTVEPRFKINDKVIHKKTGKIWTIHWYLADTNSYYVIDEEKLIHHYTEDALESAEQNPAWSEEDETNASYICAALDCYHRLRQERSNTNGQEDLDKARNW